MLSTSLYKAVAATTALLLERAREFSDRFQGSIILGGRQGTLLIVNTAKNSANALRMPLVVVMFVMMFMATTMYFAEGGDYDPVQGAFLIMDQACENLPRYIREKGWGLGGPGVGLEPPEDPEGHSSFYEGKGAQPTA
eukprot:gene875-1848_t